MRAVVEPDRFATWATVEQGGGAIVDVRSRTAVEPYLQLAPSGFVRGGLLAWAKMLASRDSATGAAGGRVGSPLPGPTRSAGVEGRRRSGATGIARENVDTRAAPGRRVAPSRSRALARPARSGGGSPRRLAGLRPRGR